MIIMTAYIFEDKPTSSLSELFMYLGGAGHD